MGDKPTEGKRGMVVGFAFDNAYSQVALVRKTRPDWQRDYLNGIGGKVEPGETFSLAMVREFREETGVSISGLEQVAMLTDPAVEVAFYRVRLEGIFGFRFPEMNDVGERIEVHYVRNLPALKTIPNLQWLVPLAAHFTDALTESAMEPILIRERKRQSVETLGKRE